MSRRAPIGWLRSLPGWLLLWPALLWPALPAWANRLGLDAITIEVAQIEELLAKRLARQQPLPDPFELQLGPPRLYLLPEQNRLGAELDLQGLDRRSGRSLRGSVTLEFGLRYDPRDASVRLVRPHIERAEVDAGAAGTGRLDRQWLQLSGPLVALLLDGFVVYRVKPGQLEAMHRAGVRPGGLRVTPQGVEIRIEAIDTAASAPN